MLTTALPASKFATQKTLRVAFAFYPFAKTEWIERRSVLVIEDLIKKPRLVSGLEKMSLLIVYWRPSRHLFRDCLFEHEGGVGGGERLAVIGLGDAAADALCLGGFLFAQHPHIGTRSVSALRIFARLVRPIIPLARNACSLKLA
jgi:hypothetical protein